jgi:hypothetical protein
MKDSLPVVLNIYRIAEDSLIDKMGIAIYHTAVEYDNTEFAFGFLDRAGISGVYDIKPMSFDEGTFVESINLGQVSRRNFFNKLEQIKLDFMANSYNILTKNCNHFTNDFVKMLFNREIPNKYASFLKIGEFLRRIF